MVIVFDDGGGFRDVRLTKASTNGGDGVTRSRPSEVQMKSERSRFVATVFAVAVAGCVVDDAVTRAPMTTPLPKPAVETPTFVPITAAKSRERIEAAFASCGRPKRDAEGAARASKVAGCYQQAADLVEGWSLPALELRPDVMLERYAPDPMQMCVEKVGEHLVEIPCPLRGERGIYEARSVGGSERFSTRRSYWFVSAGSISLTWSGGYDGVKMCLHEEGDDLVGHLATFTDYPAVEAFMSVRYRRAPCDAPVSP